MSRTKGRESDRRFFSKAKAKAKAGHTLAPVVLVSAAVILFALFFVWPGALAVLYSFTDYRGSGSYNFVGFENYSEVFKDKVFYSSLGRTLVYTLLAVPTHYFVSLGVAVLLTSSKAAGKVGARVIFFIPWLISPIVAGVIWRWLFGQDFGLVNYLIKSIGGTPIAWETNANAALVLIIVVSTWASTAFNMLLFMAAIRNIPKSYIEASKLDGASAWQRFRRVVWPLLRPTSFMVILLSTLGTMKEFAMIQALNGGGPGTQNMLIVQYIYQTGFKYAHVGYASAVSIILMLILMMIALIQLRFDKKRDLE